MRKIGVAQLSLEESILPWFFVGSIRVVVSSADEALDELEALARRVSVHSGTITPDLITGG